MKLLKCSAPCLIVCEKKLKKKKTKKTGVRKIYINDADYIYKSSCDAGTTFNVCTSSAVLPIYLLSLFVLILFISRSFFWLTNIEGENQSEITQKEKEKNACHLQKTSERI